MARNLKVMLVVVDADAAGHAVRKQQAKDTTWRGDFDADAIGRAMVAVHQVLYVGDVADADVAEHPRAGLRLK